MQIAIYQYSLSFIVLAITLKQINGNVLNYGSNNPPIHVKPTYRTYQTHIPYFLRPGFQPISSAQYQPPRKPIPAHQNIVVQNQPSVHFRNYLSFGASRILEGCDIRQPRVDCNRRIKNPSPSQCARWYCCYDERSPVKCAKNKYFIVKLAPNEDTDPAQCGIQAEEFGKPQLNIPFETLLLHFLAQRIIGGVTTVQGDWPWMVSIRKSGVPSCGGTIIHAEWILTARHCFSDIVTPLTQYSVVVGEFDTDINSTRYDRFKNVVDFRSPTGLDAFQRATFLNDIALLKVSPPIEFDEYRRPACLPTGLAPTDSDTPPTFAGDTCVVIGWGATELLPSNNILLQTNVRVLTTSDCQATTLIAPSGTYIPNVVVGGNERRFCATGSLSGDTCTGDSGGPLLCLGPDNRYAIHGITSFGAVACGSGFPGVYTKVQDFLPWIQSQIP